MQSVFGVEAQCIVDAMLVDPKVQCRSRDLSTTNRRSAEVLLQ